MLFSEPKIPQFAASSSSAPLPARFSALQRAENSSIGTGDLVDAPPVAFQCSSASRKFLNDCGRGSGGLQRDGFSALQRAENSSIPQRREGRRLARSFSALQRAENSSISRCAWIASPNNAEFQCSSASRKFLNTGVGMMRHGAVRGFSALQRAENSSIDNLAKEILKPIQFQCSSASRKFLNQHTRTPYAPGASVSVLFSEPKIPQ